MTKWAIKLTGGSASLRLASMGERSQVLAPHTGYGGAIPLLCTLLP